MRLCTGVRGENRAWVHEPQKRHRVGYRTLLGGWRALYTLSTVFSCCLQMLWQPKPSSHCSSSEVSDVLVTYYLARRTTKPFPHEKKSNKEQADWSCQQNVPDINDPYFSCSFSRLFHPSYQRKTFPKISEDKNGRLSSLWSLHKFFLILCRVLFSHTFFFR